MNEMINPRARVAIRDLMSDTILRDIDTMWQDEGFAPPAEDPEPVGGQRVTRFQGYLNQVDWTDASHVSRALRVFEIALRPLTHPTGEWGESTWAASQLDRIRRLLAKDGYTLTDDGTITGGPMPVITETLLVGITDPAVIHEHLDRIAAGLEHDDPAQVIGSTKELIESTAKLVLRQLNLPVNDKDELPDLVRRAQEAMAIHPTSAAAGPDSAAAVKKILGGAITIATGVAELRNRGYGTGHGRAEVRTGLGARHARLATNAARLWCEFVLDTLVDDQAPWRKNAIED
jgi:hypothetical protein